MAVFNYGAPGLGNVASYQVSGKPFVSGGINVGAEPDDTTEIGFPSVTRWIIITNHDVTHDISCSYSETGFTTNNYFTVSRDRNDYTNTQTQRMELKISKIFLKGASANVDVIAGLTGISTGSILNNWSGSMGVG